MGTFLRHEACPSCGSRNNLAVYTNGSWCFGCHYSSKLFDPSTFDEEIGKPSHRFIPTDASTHFSPGAVKWLTSYGLPIDEYIKRGVLYSQSRNQIVFTWPETELWQARNLDTSYRDKDGKIKNLPKYFTSGDHSGILPIYFGGGFSSAKCLVLVEDAVSGIKLASASRLEGPTIDAMPLLGTHLASCKLTRLNRLYESLVVWLDHDKGKEAMSIAKRASLLGMQARVVITEKDPKELSDSEIATLC